MEKYDELIEKLLNCALACEHCATMCLQEEDVKMMAGCIRLDRDCVDICLQAARLLRRDSRLALQYLLICEEACRLCAEECNKHQHDHCQVCAAACTACADACHEYHQPINQN